MIDNIHCDICRHSPEFDSILYTFQVLENSEKGRVLGQVKANDEDKGQYGEITYSLVGDWVQDHFKIDQATGVLVSINQPLLRHTVYHEFTVSTSHQPAL